MKKNWIVYPKTNDDIIDQILANRGIKLSERDKFLHPDYERDLLDPFKISDMEKAVKIIHDAIKNRQKIGIFADYDADGIPGAALLYKVFKLFHLDIETYIPKRTEGYGLNIEGIKKLQKNGCEILVTVDLGITDKEEIDFAKKIGMKVIVTDHHEVQKNLFPENADAIIHTHLSKNYKNKDLAGCAVAYKLAQALGKKLGKPDENQLKWFLDLPGISTICDMVPLIGENRVIAKYGLKVLRKTKILGLEELYQVSAIEKENIDAYTVGFNIGPRINAPGRIDNAEASYIMLTTSDKKIAEEVAKKLNDVNTYRQKSLEKALEEAKQKIKSRSLDKNKIIVVSGKGWPIGIIGLVSSKITEAYNRPSIVLTEEDGILRGSGRSIDKFNLVDSLKKLENLLLGFGGHVKAAGLSLKKENYEEFYNRICKIAQDALTDEDLVKKIKIDAEIDQKDIGLGLVEEIKQMEPFGLGNPKPLFLGKNFEIISSKLVGRDENHLKLVLGKKGSLRKFDAISFNCDKNILPLSHGLLIDIVFCLEENVWNNQSKVQLKIVDIDKTSLI